MKTSTFEIDHDRCKPGEWTAADVLALADLVKTGNLARAAHMSRLGMKMVASEHHKAKGGDLEMIGFMPFENDGTYLRCDVADIDDLVDDDDVFEVCRVYRAPSNYAVRIPIGDQEGNFDGYEYEIMEDRDTAVKLLSSLEDEARQQGNTTDD